MNEVRRTGPVQETGENVVSQDEVAEWMELFRKRGKPG